MLYRPSTSVWERLRALVRIRVQDTVPAVLGDGDGPGARIDVPGRRGYVYVRFPDGRSETGFALYSTPFMVRSAGAAFPYSPGMPVNIAYGDNGEPFIKSANYRALDQAGFNTATLNPLNPQSRWVYPWQLTNGQAFAVATALTNSTLVMVKSFRHYVANRFQTYETPFAADKIDLSSYIPASGLHCLAAIWIDTYTNLPEVTVSTSQALNLPFDATDVQELVDGRPPDAMPLKAFELADGQIKLMQGAGETDLRQHMDTPVILGWPQTLNTRERVQDNRTFVIPGDSSIGAGSLDLETGARLLAVHKSNISTSAPTVNDDSADGYSIGSPWFRSSTGILYIASDVTVGAAVWIAVTSGGSGFAPSDAHYVTTQAEAGLSNEFNLGGLTSGLLKQTVSTGVSTPAIAVSNTDYLPVASPIMTDATINTSITGTAIDTDATIASPSSTKVPSTSAVKGYVDQAILGLSAKADVRLVTTAPLPTLIYANGSSGVGATLTAVSVGVLTVDGVAVALNDRLLVKDQVAGLQNGIYRCTVAGALGVAFVLTRTPDADTDAEIRGCWLFSTEGTTNADQGWLNTNTSAITFGTTAITFGEFSAGAIAAGDGLTKTGNTIAVNNTVIRTTGTQAIAAGLTITAPTIADFTNMQHDHLDADDGGTLTPATFGVQTANTILAGPTTGSAANATFRASVLADLPTQIGRVQWDYFSASGTYTLPANALWLRVILTSGGSGGGGGRRGAASTIRGGGGGGSGGATVMADYYAGQIGTPGVTTKTVTIGTGGAGGTKAAGDNLNGNPGSGGNASFFGGTTIANSLLCAALPDTGSNGGAQGAAGAAAGGAGNTVLRSNFQYYGSAGGTGGNGSGATGGQFAAFGPGAGGGGAGIATGGGIDTPGSGSQGSGRVAGFPPTGAGGLGAGAGANGAASTTDGTSPQIFGSGGGGGGGSVSGAAQAGGNGSEPGGGGGGGGASLNGNASGDGGNGATGGCLIMTLCVR